MRQTQFQIFKYNKLNPIMHRGHTKEGLRTGLSPSSHDSRGAIQCLQNQIHVQLDCWFDLENSRPYTYLIFCSTKQDLSMWLLTFTHSAG